MQLTHVLSRHSFCSGQVQWPKKSKSIQNKEICFTPLKNLTGLQKERKRHKLAIDAESRLKPLKVLSSSSPCAQRASGGGGCSGCSLSCHEGGRRRRSRSCCLQTPGRAGCHQLDKVSHFARRQDYSQGQRLKWLLFELQSPKHSHTAKPRERHPPKPPSPPPPPPPDADTLPDLLFAQRSQHQRG